MVYGIFFNNDRFEVNWIGFKSNKSIVIRLLDVRGFIKILLIFWRRYVCLKKKIKDDV